MTCVLNCFYRLRVEVLEECENVRAADGIRGRAPCSVKSQSIVFLFVSRHLGTLCQLWVRQNVTAWVRCGGQVSGAMQCGSRREVGMVLTRARKNVPQLSRLPTDKTSDTMEVAGKWAPRYRGSQPAPLAAISRNMGIVRSTARWSILGHLGTDLASKSYLLTRDAARKRKTRSFHKRRKHASSTK